MNLYLIWQTVNTDYDNYDSAVVAAETIEDARETWPDKHDCEPGEVKWSRTNKTWYTGEDIAANRLSPWFWAKATDVEARLLGKAGADVQNKEVICASFNPGPG